MNTQKGKGSNLKCCCSCFRDESIREYIRKISKEIGKCNYCYQYKKTLVAPSDLSEFLLSGIERKYIKTDRTCYHSKHPYLYPESYMLEDILVNNEEILSGSCKKQDELIAELIMGMDPTEFEVIDGADYVSSCEFIKINDWSESKIWTWESFKHCIKYRNRYFNNNDVDKIAILAEIKSLLEYADVELSTKMELWRGRITCVEIDSSNRKLIEKELGPPPVQRTKNSRMNPSGIAYFYVCNDIETCLAEIKPNVDDQVWIACYCPRKKIKILDLTKAPQVIIPSIFDQTYNLKMDLAEDFLDEFQNDIAKPISRLEYDIEYVPTQAFAEFIRDEGFQGIKYKSSQNNVGYNYVLFFNNKQHESSDDSEDEHDDYEHQFLEWFWLKEFHIIKIISNSYQSQKISNKDFKKNRLPKKKNISSDDSEESPF